MAGHSTSFPQVSLLYGGKCKILSLIDYFVISYFSTSNFTYTDNTFLNIKEGNLSPFGSLPVKERKRVEVQ